MRYEAHNSLLLDLSNSIGYICDIQTYEILHLTKRGMEVCGLTTPEEYLGEKCYKILQGRDDPCPFCTNSRLKEGKNYYWEHYNEFIDSWFQLTDTLVRLEDRLCRIEIAQDITDYKMKLLQLSNEISLEGILIQCLDVLSREKDIDKAMREFLSTVCSYYNASRAYIFEFDFENQVTNNTFEWCLPGVEPAIDLLQNVPLDVVSTWIRTFESSGEFYITSLGEDVDRHSETYRLLEVQGIESLMAAPLLADGKIVGFLGVDDPKANFGELTLLRASAEFMQTELGKRRLMEELESALARANAASESKTRFLFNMSHDIRTPMNAILGFSSMTEKYIEDKERALNSLAKLNQAGKHLLQLINNVLDMARIESGKVDLSLQACHIPTTLLNTKSLFELEMQKRNLDFSVSWELEDEIAFFDPLRMAQVELNLISNAMKYTLEGGKVSYTVRQTGRSKDGYATYEAIVKDSGIGMSKEFCAHVFEPFEREQTSAVSGIQGTGLGLSIVKAFVEQMGGTIICKSESGAGSEFVFTVSFKIGEEKDLPLDTTHSTEETGFVGKRILLVEDNELNREIAADILSEYGFIIETAEDGSVAFDKVALSRAGYYDLILMDIQMPIMNGYQTTKAIRRLSNPALANLPIIAMTANAFEEDRQAVLQAGMNDHIAKPIDVPKMISILQRYIK